MNRRTRASRAALMTFAAQPWTLFEGEGGDGGGGTGNQGPTLNENGYPDATPVADMAPEHQAAYWRHHARKWETTAKAGPDADEVTRLRERDAALKKLEDDAKPADERARMDLVAATTATAEANARAEEATRRALLLEIAMDKGLTTAQAARLQGSTKEELEADAEALKALFVPSDGATTQLRGPQHQHGGAAPRAAGGVTSGAERYKARHGGTN